MTSNRDYVHHYFHSGGGWLWDRLSDGSVRVLHQDQRTRETISETILDPGTWATVIAAVSSAGDSEDRWRLARTFHGNAAPATPLTPCPMHK